MKKIFFPVMALAVFFAMAFTSIVELPIGADLPLADKKMKNVDGTEITLKGAAKANGLLVIFSCNTCPYVIKNQDRNNAICEYAIKNNIGVVVLNSNEGLRDSKDSYEEMKKYYKEQKYSWAYLLDNNSEMADAFGAKRTPECFLFNKDLKLAYHGAIDNSPADASAVTKEHLKEAINEQVAGKEISVKTSKSVGCSIKRKG